MIDVLVIFALTFALQNKLAPLLAAGGWLLPRDHPIFALPTRPYAGEGGVWAVDHAGLDTTLGRGTTPEEAALAAERELALLFRDTGGLRVWLSRLLGCAFCTGFHAGWAWALISQDVPPVAAGCWALVMALSVLNGATPVSGWPWRLRWCLVFAAAATVAIMAPGGLALLRTAFLGAAGAYLLDSLAVALERSGAAVVALKAQVDEIDQAVADLEDDRGA